LQQHSVGIARRIGGWLFSLFFAMNYQPWTPRFPQKFWPSTVRQTKKQPNPWLFPAVSAVL
jgi:hypothetical protein